MLHDWGCKPKFLWQGLVEAKANKITVFESCLRLRCTINGFSKQNGIDCRTSEAQLMPNLQHTNWVIFWYNWISIFLNSQRLFFWHCGLVQWLENGLIIVGCSRGRVSVINLRMQQSVNLGQFAKETTIIWWDNENCPLLVILELVKYSVTCIKQWHYWFLAGG